MIAALLAGALTGALVAGAGGTIVRGGVVVSLFVMTGRVVVLLWVEVVIVGCIGSQVGACLVSRCKYHVGVVAL